MFLLLASLIAIYLRLGIGKSSAQLSEKLAVHLPFSVYLGWITIASIANVSDIISAWMGWFRIAPRESCNLDHNNRYHNHNNRHYQQKGFGLRAGSSLGIGRNLGKTKWDANNHYGDRGRIGAYCGCVGSLNHRIKVQAKGLATADTWTCNPNLRDSIRSACGFRIFT